MTKITSETLSGMLKAAYEAGAANSLDLCDQMIDEIINDGERWRIYTVDELKRFPPGSKFCHALLGKGEIAIKRGLRQPFMRFANGAAHGFAADAFPWDMPCLYLGD